jgi:HlyD family secretion protein
MGLRRLVRNKIVLTILLPGVALAVYASLKTASSQAASERYRTEAVGLGEVTQTVSATGTLNPVVLVRVGTQVSGTVSKLHADFNDRVHQGQVLVELDDALFRAQVKQSEASVGNAQAALDLAVANEARLRALHRQGIVSRQELDQAVEAAKSARAQLALARAQLQKDRTNLGYTVIRSPVSGVVVDRQVDVGQTVAASFQTPTLFLIAQDLTKMQIDSSFAEADIGNIRVGQPARFTVDAFPNRPFQGTVKLIRLNPATQQNVVTYDVVVAVDNPDRILLPGMTAYVSVVVARREGVLRVPNAALRFRPVEPAQVVTSQDGREEKREGLTATVYTLDSDQQRGQLRRVSIVPGITDNRYTEVVSGDLKPGARVVVEERQAAAPASSPAGTFRIRLF